MTSLFPSRFHHVEECDDGNTISGDGCSSQCIIEPGWTCDYNVPNKCTPLLGPSADSALNFPNLGLIRVTSIIGASAVGWASFIAAPAPSGLPPPSLPLSALYILGPDWSNDAVAYLALGMDAVNAAGDVFVCPCAGGGFGPAAGVVVDEAGVLGEAAGLYARDGVACAWTFPYYSYWQACLAFISL